MQIATAEKRYSIYKWHGWRDDSPRTLLVPAEYVNNSGWTAKQFHQLYGARPAQIIITFREMTPNEHAEYNPGEELPTAPTYTCGACGIGVGVESGPCPNCGNPVETVLDNPGDPFGDE